MTDPLFLGAEMDTWRLFTWWPTGKATIHAGQPGHEREIVVNFDAYRGYNVPQGEPDEMIPDVVTEIFTALLPETWKVQSRGTRLEVHPSGHFAGGFDKLDVGDVETALRIMGLEPAIA